MDLYREFLNQAVKSIIIGIQNDKLIPIMQRQQTSQAFIFDRVKQIVILLYSQQRQQFIKKLLQIIQSLKLEIKNYEVQLGQARTISREPPQLIETVAQLKKFQKENKELRQQINQLKQKLKDAQQKQLQCQDKNKGLQKQLNKFRCQIDVFRSEKLIEEEGQFQIMKNEIENLKKEKKELNKALLKLKNQNDNFITELNKMDQVQEEIQNLKKQKNQLKNKNYKTIHQLKVKIEALQQQNKSEELQERLTKLNHQFNNYKKKMEKEKKQLLQQNQNFKQHLYELQKEHDKEKIKSKQLIKKINVLTTQKTTLEEQLNYLNQDLQASKRKSNVQNQEKLKEIISNLQSQLQIERLKPKKSTQDAIKNKQIEKYKQQIKQLKHYIESIAGSQSRRKDDSDKIQLLQKMSKKKKKTIQLKGCIRKLEEELLEKQGIIKTIQRKMKDQTILFQNNSKQLSNLNNNNLKTIKKQYNARNEELQAHHKREMKQQAQMHQDQIDRMSRHHRDQVDRIKKQGQFNLQNLMEKYQQLQKRLKQEKYVQKKQKEKEFKFNLQELMKLKQQITIAESNIMNLNHQKIELLNSIQRQKELEHLQIQKINQFNQQIKQLYLNNQYVMQLENKLEASIQFKKQMQEENVRLDNINKNLILDASKLQQTINKFAQSKQAFKSNCDQLNNRRIIAENELLAFAQKMSLFQEKNKYLEKKLQQNQKEISQLQIKLNTSQNIDNQMNHMQNVIFVLKHQKSQIIHQLENLRKDFDQLVGKNRQLNRINQSILLDKSALQQELNRCFAEREDKKIRFVRELQETQRKRKQFQDHLQQCVQKFIMTLKTDNNLLVKNNIQFQHKFMSELVQLSHYLSNKIKEYTKIKIGNLKNQNLMMIQTFQKKLEDQRLYFQSIILKERDIALRNQEEFKLQLQELNQKNIIEKQQIIRSYEQQIVRAAQKQQSTIIHTIENKLRPQFLITPKNHPTNSNIKENKEINSSVSIDNVLKNLKKDIQQQKRKLASPFK